MQVHWEHVMLELTCSQPVLYHAARSGDHSRRAGYCWELFGHWRQRLWRLTAEPTACTAQLSEVRAATQLSYLGSGP